MRPMYALTASNTSLIPEKLAWITLQIVFDQYPRDSARLGDADKPLHVTEQGSEGLGYTGLILGD